jgi:hypothetical protein
MDRDLKIQDIAGAAVFGALGLAALAGVIFAGAKHQLVMVCICAAMVWALVAEIRREERRAKANNSTNQ